MTKDFQPVLATTWQLYSANWWRAICKLCWIVMIPLTLVVTIVPLVLLGSLVTTGNISFAVRLADLASARIIPLFVCACFALMMLYFNWILKLASQDSAGNPRWLYSPEWTSGILICLIFTVPALAADALDTLWWVVIQVALMLLSSLAIIEALVYGGNPLRVLLRTGKTIVGHPLQSLTVTLVALAGVALGSLIVGLGLFFTVPLVCLLGAVWYFHLRGIPADPVAPTPIQAPPASQTPYVAGR